MNELKSETSVSESGSSVKVSINILVTSAMEVHAFCFIDPL